MIYVDATCPLVSKVHIEAARHHENGLQMIMIGHEGHPETVGTMGQLPEGEVLLVETVEDVGKVDVRDPDRLAFLLQHLHPVVRRRVVDAPDEAVGRRQLDANGLVFGT